MLNKMIIKELKQSKRILCQSVDNCINLATNSILIKGESKKCVCNIHLIKFFKLMGEIKVEGDIWA